MNIKLYSKYDHFPKHHPEEGKPFIDCYNDIFVKDKVESGSIALLIEPRNLQPETYTYIEKHYKKFKYVFTHDSKILKKCPNAKLIIWGNGNGNYFFSQDVSKWKQVSMVASDKEYCWFHKARMIIANELKQVPDVDVMGTFDGGEFVDTKTIYSPYRFSVALENYKDDYWMTEKIFNCFLNKTVPIYFGANKIDEYFDTRGIIRVNNWEDIPNVIDTLRYLGFERQYEVRKPYIEYNYRHALQYGTFEDWFFKEYGELLNE